MAAVRTGATHARTTWPLAVLLLAVVAGLVFASGAVISHGSDLRGAGGDVSTLLQDRKQRINAQRVEARSLRSEVDALSHAAEGRGINALHEKVRTLEEQTGLSPARGPGIRVSLQDAPRSADRAGVDPNWLVVHQQDIQTFVNALWAGGAQAISLQGQRLVSTTGVKCVGSTVVLDGVPYSPPYVLEAIGDQDQLMAALDSSLGVDAYRRDARLYGLGLDIERDDTLDIAPYAGQVALNYARVPASG